MHFITEKYLSFYCVQNCYLKKSIFTLENIRRVNLNALFELIDYDDQTSYKSFKFFSRDSFTDEKQHQVTLTISDDTDLTSERKWKCPNVHPLVRI